MSTSMLKHLMLGSLLSLTFASGCDTKSHGECSTDEDMHWFKRTQYGGPLGTNKWCVVCDSTVSLEDADLWVEDNAGESFLDGEWRVEGVTPCLYVYSDEDEDFAEAAVCEAAACAPDPDVNDPVYENHGMWVYIEPILFGD